MTNSANKIKQRFISVRMKDFVIENEHLEI
jgi:hypothetical protein